LRISTTFCFGVAAALLLAGGPALAQVYSWKDPETGQTRFSNIAPRWYSRGETVSGPRVIVTAGDKVIDDTALAYDDRLRISGKPMDRIEKLRLQQPAPPRQAERDSAAGATSGMRPAEKTATR